ncbi:MAG: hypothetical protein L0G99_15185 [Propionibacteriales bacterium]|nr:hypothetical protein [Propionibacteriales bacterium]
MSNARATAPPPRPPAAAQASAAPTGQSQMMPAGRAGAPVHAGQQRRREARTTPQLLRIWMLISVASALVFGLVTMLTMINTADAQTRAADNTAQMIRVQEIQAKLLRADALATNAFLIGGLEPADQRADYDAALDDTSRLIVEASQAQPADREALIALNQVVTDYAAAMEQARANNRQGLPAGAAYLEQASTGLRAGAMPVVDSLVQANESRATDEMDSLNAPWLVVLGIICILAQIGCCVWCARRFRRVVNVPLLISTALMALTWIIALSAVSSANASADNLQNSDYQMARNVARARIAGNEAKAQESLGLISHGSPAVSEQAWTTQDAAVRDALEGTGSTALLDDWDTYATEHRAIRKLDDAGKWEEAVKRATGTGTDGANKAFATFDVGAAALVESAGTSTVDTLRSGAWPAIVLAWLLTPAAVAAAVLAGIGIRTRQREYQP